MTNHECKWVFRGDTAVCLQRYESGNRCYAVLELPEIVTILNEHTALKRENERRGDAIVHACNHARPYVDESGIVCISLNPYGRLKRIALEIQDALADTQEGG